MDKGNYSRIGRYVEIVIMWDCMFCYMKYEIKFIFRLNSGCVVL